MNEDLERVHDMLVAAFMALSPALFVAFFAILLGLLLWALRQALRNVRIVQAVAKAPLVDLRSTVAGLVKVLHTLWFIVQAPLTLLCLGLLGFGTWVHLMGYPPGADGPAATFLDALRTTL